MERIRLLVVLLALAMVASACGGSSSRDAARKANVVVERVYIDDYGTSRAVFVALKNLGAGRANMLLSTWTALDANGGELQTVTKTIPTRIPIGDEPKAWLFPSEEKTDWVFLLDRVVDHIAEVEYKLTWRNDELPSTAIGQFETREGRVSVPYSRQ